MKSPLSPEARFLQYVDKTDTCWLWTGAGIKSTLGYGFFFDGARSVNAHRWSFEHFVGNIPFGFVTDHLCRVPQCVNPAHMELVTQRQNVLRGIGLTAQNARKTVCKRGHPYDLFNTYYEKKGRQCRECRRLANRGDI